MPHDYDDNDNNNDDDDDNGRTTRREAVGFCCSAVFEGCRQGVVEVFFLLSFQNHKPSCRIVDFYAPALDTFAIDNNNNYYHNHYNITNTSIFFDLKLENTMPFNGLLYGNLNLTFSYGGPPGKKIGSLGLPGFYQGMRKTTHRRDVANTSGVPWVDAFASVSKNGSSAAVVVFRVDLETEVRSKCYFWYRKKQRVVVGGDVRVGNTGVQVGDVA
ncbi:hypothetical protein MIMGU_mgv1a026319mg, partial [Erythranthe guttata]